MGKFLIKWFYVVRYNISRGSGDFFGILMQQIGIIQITGATALIWVLNGGVGVLSYILVGKLFFNLSYNDYQLRLGSRIISGKMITSLMTPQDIFLEGFVVSIGYRAGLVLTNLIGVVAILIIFALSIPDSIILPSTFNQWLFLVYVPIAFIINYLFGIIVGSSAFVLRDKLNFDGVVQSYTSSMIVLSGSIIPLDKIPELKFLEYLPSAWLLHHPMQVYLGNYNLKENVIALVSGLIWILILFVFAKLVFKKGLKYHEANGL
jgi:ABC-type uncharacterized transport system permease subunit